MRNSFPPPAAALLHVAAAAARRQDGRFLSAGKVSERDPSLFTHCVFALLGASVMTAAADASRRHEFFALLPDADLHVATKFLKQASD